MNNNKLWIDNCLFASPIYYALCKNEKDYFKLLKSMNVSVKDNPDFLLPGADATTHFFINGNKTAAIVCIYKTNKYKKSQICAMLAHEAMHIWQEILIKIGEKNPSIEFEAYCVQAIVQNLIERYYGQD